MRRVLEFAYERPWLTLALYSVVVWASPLTYPWQGLIKLALIFFWLGGFSFAIILSWNRPQYPSVTPEDGTKVAELRQRFPFVNPDAKVFADNLEINFTSDPPGLEYARIRKLNPASHGDYDRAIALIQRAAMFERHQRGYPLRDKNNALNWPEFSADGFIIEQHENDDGSVDAVVAYDLDEPVSQRDYDEAWHQLGITGRYSDWKRSIYAPWQARYICDDMVPLYKPALRTVRVSAATASGNPFRPRSTEKGAAQWAWVDEMRASPMLEFKHCSELALDAPQASAGAPLGIFAKSDWMDWPRDDFAAIATHGEGHRIIVGPPGSGKFTAAFAPLLLMADHASAVVFDVANGEAARVTAGWRAQLGPVLVIDPFGVPGQESGALNPLDFLRADDEDILQAAKRLTDALFITAPGTASDEYFNDQARDVLTAYLLHVATDFSEKSDRTLRRVRELIRRPLSPDVLAAMQDNPVAGGVVRDVAANLFAAAKADAERNTFYVTQTLRANTAFLDLPAVQRATERTTLDPHELRRQVSTLYVCLPEAQLVPVGRWLRLVYATIMEHVRDDGGVPLHVLIDEFPAFGRFPRVKDDMALVRKLGIHFHIAAQSLTQLEGLYGPEWQAFMAASRYQQLLGVNDHTTAEYFSKRLGKTTRRSTSTSQSRSTGGGSQSEGAGWEAADLASPDELGRMSADFTVVVVEGMNPLVLRKHHYYQGLLGPRLGGAAPEEPLPDADGPVAGQDDELVREREEFTFGATSREDREFSATQPLRKRARSDEPAE